MPRKFRQPKRRLGVAARLIDLPFGAELDFVLCWSPPQSDFDRARSQWDTWLAYVEAYQPVRGEVLTRYGDRLRAQGRVPFAERVLAFAEHEGAEALASATYEVVSDYSIAADDGEEAEA